MNAEIIAVGTELLLGQILNTNARFLSQKLALLGIDVYYQTVVGDNVGRLKSAIDVAKNRADILIFTGGLGPTKDDLTKETIASCVGTELVYDEQAMQYIEHYFKRTGRPVTENNKKQALVLKGASIFANDHGMAPGMGLEEGEKLYILLPGPPKEMNPMYESYVEPFLMKKVHREAQLYSRVLRFFGIGESQLETEIEDIIDSQTNPTIAPYASDGEVTLRITAKHSSSEIAQKLINETEARILNRVGSFFYGYDEMELHVKATELLKEKGLTLSCAESLTGGHFSQRITDIPGASEVFNGGIICYSNEVKQQVLQVPQAVLESEGAVSAVCAGILAQNVRHLLKTDIGISFTGAAGPDGLEGKAPGTVYLGIAAGEQPPFTVKLSLVGSRQVIRERTVKYGFYYLLKKLEEL
ncbi:competence/damage-inducible protein A [Bacillus sp. 165]|uniref:competence/damage-inducible protein A n=1 Tax=Bacillus sp. 165 TaxID=1529117 RepID=UPI001ADC4927|nr:competence/damage-inducible protein A [Bacillus sp. 165]MBO9128895.1 competence/damage-inducible protein A [Bacillus sp. 165]